MCYPTNYDFLSEQQKDAIVSYLNNLKQKSENAYLLSTQYVNIPQLYKSYSETEKEAAIELRTCLSLLKNMGIFARYNMPGKRGQWSLVTQEDMDNWAFQCSDNE